MNARARAGQVMLRPTWTDDPDCVAARDAGNSVVVVEAVPHRGAPYSIGGKRYSVDGAYFYQTDEIAGANPLDILSIYNDSDRIVVVHRTGLLLYGNAGAGTPLFELVKITAEPTGGTTISGVKRADAESPASAVARSSPTATDTANRIAVGFSPREGGPHQILREPPSAPIALANGEGLLWFTADDATNIRIAAFFETFEVSK